MCADEGNTTGAGFSPAAGLGQWSVTSTTLPASSVAFPGPVARRWARAVAEVLLAVVTVLSALVSVIDPPGPGGVFGFAAGFLPATFLWLRQRRPVPVLLACLALYAILVFFAHFTPASVLPVAVALYSFVVRHPRRQGLYVAGAALVYLVTLAWIAGGDGFLDPDPFPIAVSVGFATAAADAVRNRRAYIAEIIARADRAEATRESEAARRVSEERLRIARDLHDVVAHQISLISLNASVALTALDAKPDQARASLLTIRGASRRVLGDIGNLLAVLRSDDEPSLDPQPGLGQLPDLVDDFNRTGLAVTVRHEGGVPQLTPTGDVVAYRAIQETLTNAARHGSQARAHVLLSSTADQVHLVITNPTESDAFGGDGFGLSGMRERVASVRGTMDIAVEAGVFRLEIRLPREVPDGNGQGWAS